jgi:hypothetical protein
MTKKVSLLTSFGECIQNRALCWLSRKGTEMLNITGKDKSIYYVHINEYSEFTFRTDRGTNDYFVEINEKLTEKEIEFEE